MRIGAGVILVCLAAFLFLSAAGNLFACTSVFVRPNPPENDLLGAGGRGILGWLFLYLGVKAYKAGRRRLSSKGVPSAGAVQGKERSS